MRRRLWAARRILREEGAVALAGTGAWFVLSRLPGFRTALGWYRFARKERKTGWHFDVPIHRRVDLIRRGFLSQADVIYDFDAHGYRPYLTDYRRWVNTPWINGDADAVVTDKWQFDRALEAFEAHRPEVFGVLEDGRFRQAPSAEPARAPLEALEGLLEEVSILVIKPRKSGGGGVGVVVLERTPDGYALSGDHHDASALRSWLAGRDGYLVTEYVEQAEYAADLYPDAANTIRILTMMDDEGPFVGAAFHRIGTDASKPVDNWSAGGLSAAIDTDGTLSAATRFPRGDRLERLDRHPDTGAQLSGLEVPAWGTIRERVLAMAEAVPDVVYLGWDVLPTDDGFVVLEGNAHVGVEMIQTHRPLLADERVCDFYASHGVIDPARGS